MFTAGCSSSDDEVKPLPEEEYDVQLSFSYEGNWNIRNASASDPGVSSYIEDYISAGVGRHIIKIYKADEVSSGATPAVALETDIPMTSRPYDFTMTVRLQEGNYVVKAWTDFRESTSESPYYRVTNFSQIMLDRHPGLTAYQDAFSGSKSFGVSGTLQSTSVEVPMTRPVGRYMLIAEDFTEMLEKTEYAPEELNVTVSYTGFYPDTYSVMTDRLTDSLTGENYIIKPESLADGKALVGTDFMLMNSGGSSTSLQIRIVNAKGEVIATGETMTVPMNRNEVTVISGRFLNIKSDDGGFGLDTGFDGDINITPG